MMKLSVQVDLDSVSELVRKCLMYDYKLINQPDKIDCSDDVIDPDEELLKALETVIEYYSTTAQFKEWKNSL